MTAEVSKFVVQTLCDNHGSVDFQSLIAILGQRFTVATSILRQVLSEDGKVAVIPGVLAVGQGQLFSQDSLIVAKTALRLCQKKPGECTQCHNLHLCKFYVLGSCAFGFKCKLPHTVTCLHNAELLKKLDLQFLSEKQLFRLLLQNDPFLLPEICAHYNMGEGQHGLCKFASTCSKLHICLSHFTTGVCNQGSSCSRIHNVDVKSHKSFEKFTQEMVKELPKVYKNKCAISNQHNNTASAAPGGKGVLRGPAQHPSSRKVAPSAGPTKPARDTNEKDICLFFISKRCRYTAEQCVYDHWHLPYRWQVLDCDGVTWNDFTNMEEIEKAYCDPTQNSSCMDQSRFFLCSPHVDTQVVNFLTMTCKGSKVRRLSTASSVSKPPHFNLTTQWLWYWQDETGKWNEYGQSNGNTPASITSESLENMYLGDQTLQIPFSAGKQQYVIHFSGYEAGTQRMYQQNLKFSTKREVRRRPRFVSAADVDVKRQSSSSLKAECPAHWDEKAVPDIGFKLVPLPIHTEYQRIEKLFKATMSKSTIKSIRRVQNPFLWTAFQCQKEQMKKRNGGNPVSEKYLFHGTDGTLIESICEQNFDWRICGVHGTAFGRGSYFAEDASYSNRYAKTKSGVDRCMFAARVLVGDYTQGRQTHVRPPTKGNTTTLYDSCVDNEANPKIFVIFEKPQIYPEYIIDYTE
ncbi:protein mono-ADP-ribosyltransferase PARP12 isoform X1 [Nerophis lumbriciformis]|uniref:protein mono-ADP-ribosyltransferase PARP12 isoform X1 n=1 Tax=Nerophis lumbriciformis TaxID=546530 RepID=UPI002ADF1E7C|nr:protein mono-ADP-ribosyltransferase PARP12-like isoform X1 [Nerophis lumbriciformis]